MTMQLSVGLAKPLAGSAAGRRRGPAPGQATRAGTKKTKSVESPAPVAVDEVAEPVYQDYYSSQSPQVRPFCVKTPFPPPLRPRPGEP